MDQIAQQLKAEIASLREYIQRTEERLQVRRWVDALIPPFEYLERDLDEDELRIAIRAFYQAKYRFSVNGHLSTQIDAILSRHAELAESLKRSPDEELVQEFLPAKDPEYSSPVLPDRLQDSAEASTLFAAAAEDEEIEPLDLFAEKEEVLPAGTGANDASLFHPSSLSAEENEEAQEPILPETLASVDSLSSQKGRSGRQQSTADLQSLFQDATRPLPKSVEKTAKAVKLRKPRPSPAAEEEATVDLFAAKIGLDDLLMHLGISLPSQDKVQLEHALHHKVADRAIAALRTNPIFEKQYILLPRISRFFYNGTLYPCTVKNLAKTYIALFGSIQDLIAFKSFAFFNEEVPELGWALITAEAPRESLDKNYMEQNQYLRYLAATAGIPSHLVRRRTLVEAVYDLIVSRLVLNTTWQRQTLDWTASGTSKNDFICVYFAENGIRMRELARTRHHRALGCCPNW